VIGAGSDFLQIAPVSADTGRVTITGFRWRRLAGAVALVLGGFPLGMSAAAAKPAPPPAPGPAPVTAVLIDSELNDQVSSNMVASYTPANATITADGNAEQVHVRVAVPPPTGYSADMVWDVVLMPAPNTTLTTGDYAGAVPPGYRGEADPGLQVSGPNNGICFGGLGSFTIHQLTLDGSGQLAALAATVHEDCDGRYYPDGGRFHADLRWNSTYPYRARTLPGLLWAPQQTVGTSGPDQTFTITNGGPDALHVGALSLAGDHAAAFAITADGCSGQTIPAGGHCDVTFHFAPPAGPVGEFWVTLVVPDDINPAGRAVMLAGQALAAEPASLVVAPAYSSNPSAVALGTSFPVTVKAVDAYGNFSPAPLTYHLTSSDGDAVLPADTPADTQNPFGTNLGALFCTSGPQTLTAAAVENPAVNGTMAVTVGAAPGPAASFTLDVAPTAEAGEALDAEVAAWDACGNIATGFTGTVVFDTSDDAGDVPNPHQFTAGDAGVYQATEPFVFRTPGEQYAGLFNAYSGLLDAVAVNVTSPPAPPPPPDPGGGTTGGSPTDPGSGTAGGGSGPGSPAPQTPSGGSGYWMVGADGIVYPFGDARWYGNAMLFRDATAVDLEPTPSGNGYWIVDSLGRVSRFGDAVTRGSVLAGQLDPGETVTSLSATPSGQGYWIFTSRGRVLAFGDAPFLGDVSGLRLNGPVLDSIATPSGKGYYMVGSDGGIFAFGDAKFYGSMGGQRLNAPVQSLVPDGDGVGYWLVASDGGIFAFQADFKGSMGATRLNRPITGMVRAGRGYLMVGEDGGIFDFSGDPTSFKGSLGANPPARPISSVAVLEPRPR
jgi:hypothetical protein